MYCLQHEVVTLAHSTAANPRHASFNRHARAAKRHAHKIGCAHRKRAILLMDGDVLLTAMPVKRNPLCLNQVRRPQARNANVQAEDGRQPATPATLKPLTTA